MRDYLYYGDKSIADFEAYITDAGSYDSPERSYERVEVPGRDGDLIMENDRYPNVEHAYPAVIVDNFDSNYKALVAFLLAQKGYKKLSDSFHPDEFYLATFKRIEGLKQKILPKAGTFKIVFDRKPQRFLVSGEKKIVLSSNGILQNPTYYDAKPLIKVTGIGVVGINGTSVEVNESGITIDCEMQEAYKDGVYKNNKIVLDNGVFPVLKSGINNVQLSSVTEIEVTPRWWTL